MLNPRKIAGAAVFLAAGLLACAPAMGQVVQHVTDVPADLTSLWPIASIVGDGSTAYAVSSTNQFGDNPEHRRQIFRFDLTNGTGALLVDLPGTASAVSVDDAGQWLAFVSSGDPLGTNHDESSELFVMKTDGTGLAQLTDIPRPELGGAALGRISGDGSTVLFQSNADLDGSNPAHAQVLWSIKRDGTGLTRLFTNPSYPWDVSDDGTRVVLASSEDPLGTNPDGSYEIFAINGDGTNLRQLTSGPFGSTWAMISGDGSTVVIQSNDDLVPLGNLFGIATIYAMNWDGTGTTQLTDGQHFCLFPIPTDNGQTVYFESHYALVAGQNTDENYEIWAVNRNGSGTRAITDTVAPDILWIYYPSGDGSRLLAPYYDDPPAWANDPDRSGELVVMNADGSQPLQLTFDYAPVNAHPDVTGAGDLIVFDSGGDLAGSNPGFDTQIFSVGADGANLTQLTAHSGGSDRPRVSGDGSTIVFNSTGNPTLGNADGSSEVFAMNGDGTNLRQLTSTPGGSSSHEADISQNGSLVAFVSDADLDGAEGGGTSPDVFVVHPDGSGLQRITTEATLASTRELKPRLDATGTWVVFLGDGDLTGNNPGGYLQVFRARTDGSVIEQITSFASSFTVDSPTISGDGRWIAYSSSGDPVGMNSDGNFEVFLYDTQSASTTQVTVTDRGFNGHTSISNDSAWLYFSSNAPLMNPGDAVGGGVFRWSIPGGPLDRVSGLGIFGAYDSTGPPGLSADGQIAVWSSSGSEDGSNQDRSTEIVLADQGMPAKIYVDPQPATVVSWTAESGPIRYDVIRGDVANLSETGLGPVVCLEDDSPDNDTIGYEDTESPAAGKAFFYLYRGTEGQSAGPGSYGTTSSGAERQPDTGGCADN